MHVKQHAQLITAHTYTHTPAMKAGSDGFGAFAITSTLPVSTPSNAITVGAPNTAARRGRALSKQATVGSCIEGHVGQGVN